MQPGALPWLDDSAVPDEFWPARLNFVVGPHGSGKSTLLRHLRRSGANPSVTFIQPRVGWDMAAAWRCVLSGGPVMVDGWERWSPGLRLIIRCLLPVTGTRVLSTSHRQHRGGVVVLRLGWSDALARRLVGRLTVDCDPEIRGVIRRALEDWLRRPAGRMYRELFFDLYDVAQRHQTHRERRGVAS